MELSASQSEDIINALLGDGRGFFSRFLNSSHLNMRRDELKGRTTVRRESFLFALRVVVPDLRTADCRNDGICAESLERHSLNSIRNRQVDEWLTPPFPGLVHPGWDMNANKVVACGAGIQRARIIVKALLVCPTAERPVQIVDRLSKDALTASVRDLIDVDERSRSPSVTSNARNLPAQYEART